MSSNVVLGPASTHPRRPTAERSVSLKHSPRLRLARQKQRNSDSSSDGGVPQPRLQRVARSRSLTHSPSSLNPLGGQASSGESSNAEKWFEQSNNEVRDHRTDFTDNDPPFFMRNSSSSETPPDVLQHQQQQRLRELLEGNGSNNSLPIRTGLLHLGTDGSSTEEYRSVIDDLTIKNKKLKRRLKKYEKLHDSHLKDEKLFEVRFHGLPPAKKRELEETLRKFAAGLNTKGANPFPPNGYASLVPMLHNFKTTSSQTSVQNTDSAYASMSASHPESSGHQSANNDAKAKLTPSMLASRRQNIHSYLHDIPESLMPHRTPTSMTERAKKKLVVRRLENIFAGKDAAKNGHQQSMQQEEVSQSAARADRSAIEATGQLLSQEGAREASIMLNSTEEAPKYKRAADAMGRENDKDTSAPVPAPDEANLASSEQRPTRPLDLDIQREQVPADNIRYMRHLGFSPLDPQLSAAQEDGHGYIYLNFLINMAQLHTINVTPDFVRKALGEYSDKFEISPDGRKVRWKGGEKGGQTSSSGGNSSSRNASDNTPDGQSPRKRPKLFHATSQSTSGGRTASEFNKYAYTPLFFHRDNSDEADDSSSEEEDEGYESPMRAQPGGDSSNMTSSGMQTVSGMQTSSGLRTVGAAPKKSKRDDGPIIFYNNANFCTDLSGDARVQTGHDFSSYTTATDQAIGKAHVPTHELFDKRGPLDQASQLPEPMNLSDNPIPESMELAFPPVSPLKSEGKNDRKHAEKPVELEVTGIGGVWPADNFAISVESRHARTDQAIAPKNSGNDRLPRSVPSKLDPILHGSSTRGPTQRAAIHKQQILTSNFTPLAPSPLPPAIQYMPFGEENMDEDSDSDSDNDDDRMSIQPESPGGLPPATAPQPVDFAYGHSSDEDDSDNSDNEDEAEASEAEESDDGSVDLLAAARQLDPEAVRAKEREYDANMAERLAEEIPAGSSAATAGGGSGFASPGSGVTKEEYLRARKEARAAAAASAAAAAGATNASGAVDFATGGRAGSGSGRPGSMHPPPTPASAAAAAAPAGLKRARTGDSMDLHRGSGFSDGSDGEDDEMKDADVSDVGS